MSIRRHWRRSGLVALACAWFILAVSYLNVRELEAPVYGAVLPALFAAAGLSILLLVVRPSYGIWRLSGGLTIVAVATRPIGVLTTWITEGSFRSPWSIVIAFVVFPTMAALLWWFWIQEVGPWYRRHRDDALIAGD